VNVSLAVTPNPAVERTSRIKPREAAYLER
jgi:hypothetical protein